MSTPNKPRRAENSSAGRPAATPATSGSGANRNRSGVGSGGRKGRRKRHWTVRLAGWLVGLLLAGIIGAVAVFFIGYATIDIPDPNEDFKTETTFVYYADARTPIGTFNEQNRLSVSLESIPKITQNAVIAAEDRTYWSNAGVSPSGIVRSAWAIARGGQLQGGSTITQQYVKLLYLTQERTVTRKFKELFIAMKVNKAKNKQEVLQGYLNTIYFGRGAYGVWAASKAYFGTGDLSKLTLRQSAFLAAILNSPGNLSPDEGPDSRQRLVERYNYVLDGMRELGMITPAVAAEAIRAGLPPITADAKKNRYAGWQGFLLYTARKQLEANGISDAEINGGGLRVVTTFDRDLQTKMVAAAENERPKKGDQDLHIAMASVRPQTGELVAMYGGPNFLNSQINWAMSRARPGSSFKPFAVAAALKDPKLSLKTGLQGNSPITVNGKQLNNEFDRDYGRVNLLRATEDSINTAFYDLVDNKMEGGPAQVADTAQALGIPKIPTSDRSAPSIVLGPNAYASPVDMTGAYASFAANGRHNPLYLIRSAKKADGTVVFQHAPKPRQAIAPEIAAEVNYALQRVVSSGTGTRARELGRPVAGKTGTAGAGDNTLTSWWVGYTPQLSTAVLYRAGPKGESDLDPYSEDPAFFGGNWPLRSWLAYMKPALQGEPELKFAERSRDNSGAGTSNGDSDGDSDGDNSAGPTTSQSRVPTPSSPIPSPSRTQPPTTATSRPAPTGTSPSTRTPPPTNTTRPTRTATPAR